MKNKRKLHLSFLKWFPREILGGKSNIENQLHLLNFCLFISFGLFISFCLFISFVVLKLSFWSVALFLTTAWMPTFAVISKLCNKYLLFHLMFCNFVTKTPISVFPFLLLCTFFTMNFFICIFRLFFFPKYVFYCFSFVVYVSL